MICPVCHTEIPEGSNICPHCYTDLMKTQQTRYHKPAKTGSPVKLNPQALIVAGGLFIVLLVLVVVLVRFLFSGGTPDPKTPQGGGAQPTVQPAETFAVFGATVMPVDVTTPEPVVIPTPTPAPQVTPEPNYVTVKSGDKNDNVKAVQQALIALGYLSGNADGIFGKNTETAVKEFQKANNLKDDGIAGGQTQSALFKKYSAVSSAQGQTQTQAPLSSEPVPNLPG